MRARKPRYVSLFFVLLLPLRIHGEPALADAVVLLVQFKNAPETGEGDDAENDTYILVRDEDGGDQGGSAGQQKRGPALTTKMLFPTFARHQFDAGKAEISCVDSFTICGGTRTE